jgi:hypothetical protein
MLKTLNDDGGHLSEILYSTPNIITVEYRNDLVVGLATVDHLDTAKHFSLQNNVSAVDIAL